MNLSVGADSARVRVHKVNAGGLVGQSADASSGINSHS